MPRESVTVIPQMEVKSDTSMRLGCILPKPECAAVFDLAHSIGEWSTSCAWRGAFSFCISGAPYLVFPPAWDWGPTGKQYKLFSPFMIDSTPKGCPGLKTAWAVFWVRGGSEQKMGMRLRGGAMENQFEHKGFSSVKFQNLFAAAWPYIQSKVFCNLDQNSLDMGAQIIEYRVQRDLYEIQMEESPDDPLTWEEFILVMGESKDLQGQAISVICRKLETAFFDFDFSRKKSIFIGRATARMATACTGQGFCHTRMGSW